jgi:gas vesicle protein
MKTFWNFLSGLVLGAAVGAVCALVLAPKAGEDFRADLKREIEDILEEGRKAAALRRQELEEELARLRRE